jgi:hypothetical protein
MPIYAYKISGSPGVTAGETGYTGISYFEITNLPSFLEADTGYMAINWTIEANENSGNGKSQIYIDFYNSVGVTYTPDTINATTGGAVLSQPMTNTSGFSPNNMVSISANDYVNLNGYQNEYPINNLYCNLYQKTNIGTTAFVENYNMSLTFAEIGPIGPQGPQGSPLGITGGVYNP